MAIFSSWLDILEIIPSEEIGVSLVLSREELVSIKSSALWDFNSARILCRSLSSLISRDSASAMADIKEFCLSLLSIRYAYSFDIRTFSH